MSARDAVDEIATLTLSLHGAIADLHQNRTCMGSVEDACAVALSAHRLTTSIYRLALDLADAKGGGS